MQKDVQINRKTVFNSLVWKSIERVLTQGINLVVQVILARLLLPETFGSLAIIVTITTYANIFVQSGLATSIVQKQELDDWDISTVLIASLGIALICYLLIFCAAPWISRYYQLPELKWALRVLAIVLFLNAIYSVENALLSRNMEFKKLLKRSMIAIPIAGTVSITMAYLGCGIWSLVALTLTNMAVTVLVLGIGSNLRVKFRFSVTKAKEIYSFSGKILIANLLTGLHDALRTMLIGKIYSSKDLAYYDKANTYAGYISDLSRDSISSVLLPTFSRKQEHLDQIKAMARKSVGLGSFVMFPVLLGFMATSKSFVLVVLTSKWEKSIPFLMIFCILRLATVLKNIDFQVYYALGSSGINLIYCIVFSFINIMALLFSVRIGIMEVAIAATITEYLSFIAIMFISSNLYNYSILERIKDMSKPAINAALMSIAVWNVQRINAPLLFVLILQVVIGIIVYVGLALTTKDENLTYIINLIKEKRIKKNNSI